MSIIKNQIIEFDERRLLASFLKKRSESAFMKLYQRYTPIMYQLSLRLMGGSTVEAEEVVQEVWVRAIQKLHSFKWKSSLKTWLNAFVINCCREHQRILNRMNNHELTPEQNVEKVPEKGEFIDLEMAIIRLPDGYRQVLILHDLEGYKHSEIADFLGVSVGTSKSQLFQARKAVRNYLNIAA